MKRARFAEVAAAVVLLVVGGARGSSQSTPPTEGPSADGSPGWFLQDSFRDPGGQKVVEPGGHVTIVPRSTPSAAPPASVDPLRCARSPLCGNRLGRTRQSLERVQWRQTLGYSFAYPYMLPPGSGGAPSVGVDSKGNVWVFQRADAGKPQLFKFDVHQMLVLQVGPETIGYQDKSHGLAVDADDNVWITAASGATVIKVSPDGKLLLTIGERGRRGDWNESKGQRLLWQPMMVAFGRNGDIFIGEGHADESPNDAQSDDPANNIGAARVLHLDKDGAFLNQWYGNEWGPGKFSSAHGLAVDPVNGDVWIGDREEYRIVIYSADGRFLRTIQLRNLVCAIYFDSHAQPWIATGHDGQFLKMDRTGKVLGAIGNGEGIGTGQFTEASYWGMDKDDNLYAGDTGLGRVTKMVAPRK